MIHRPYQVQYSSVSRKWLHSRVPSEASKLYPVDADIPPVLPPSRLTHEVNFTIHDRPQKLWARHVTQDAPEAAPALEFLGPYLEESHVIATHTENTDPVIRNLLSFGKAASHDPEGRESRNVNVAAWAMGPVGSELGLGLLGERRMREEGVENGREVVMPRIFTDEERVAWYFGAPIRQVRFAGGVGETGRPQLAVRTSASTTLFRPSRDHAVRALPTSCSVKELLSISADDVPHADVDFNPLYGRQLAIVDETGAWKVYELEGKSVNSRFSTVVKEYTSGSLHQSGEELLGGTDGWGRVTWGADVNSLVVAGRKKLALFDIREKGKGSVVNVVDIGDRDSWLLDISRGPEEQSKSLWMLTDKSVEWVDLRMGKPVRSVNHWRHGEDRTLALEVFKGAEDITNVLIYSRRNFLITSYRFSDTIQGETFPTVVGDPYIFANPSPTGTAPTENTPLNLCVLPCKTKDFMATANIPANTSTPKSDDNLYFTAFNVNNQLGVSQHLYCSDKRSEKFVPVLSYRESREDMVIRRDRVRFKSPKFVEDSDSDSTVTPGEESDTNVPGSKNPASKALPTSHRRTDLSSLYNHVYIDAEESLRPPLTDGEHSVDGFIHAFEGILRKRMDRGDLGISALLEVSSPKHLFDNLPLFSSQLRTLLEHPDIADAFESKSLVPENPSIVELEELYNSLLQIYIHPLPSNVPGKIRLRRERICRIMATEIYLASQGLSLKPHPSQIESLIPLTPPRPSLFPKPLTDSQGQEQISRKESIVKLRTYAHVQNRITLPERFQSVLDTWDVGADPAEYEYVSPDATASDSTRRRRVRKQKGKEKEIGKGKGVDRSGVGDGLSAFGGSQPPRLQVAGEVQQAASQVYVGMVGSSQVPGGEGSQGLGVIMSQVERGKFGSRPQVKKKRRTGF
ncbi:hypothetical protein RUND412_006778 [Rhizina undulata]